MIIIHTGFHKSGSTSIQRFAAGNVELLAGYGIDYPRIGRGHEAHHALKNEVRDGLESVILNELSGVCADNPDRTFVLSAEGFGLLAPASVDRFLTALSRRHEIRAVMYVRPRAGALVSSYNQLSKRGFNTDGIDAYIHFRRNSPSLGGVVKTWADRLGPARVRVRTLEPEALVGGELLQDFASAIGLPPEEFARTDPVSRQRANIAVSWETAEYVRAFTRRSISVLSAMSEADRTAIRDALPRGVGMKQQPGDLGKKGPYVDKIVTGPLALLCEAALVGHGEVPPIQYLTPEHVRKLDDDYRRILDDVAAASNDVNLAHVVPATPPPRPREPDLGAIEPWRAHRIDDHLRASGFIDRLPTPIAAIFDDMKADPTDRTATDPDDERRRARRERRRARLRTGAPATPPAT